jgi:hypothetical protein
VFIASIFLPHHPTESLGGAKPLFFKLFPFPLSKGKGIQEMGLTNTFETLALLPNRAFIVYNIKRGRSTRKEIEVRTGSSLMIRKFVLLALLIIGLLLAGCNGGTVEMGTLEGRVTIGPLRPVERPGEKRPIPPEVYEARKVMVYDKKGSKLVKKVDLGQDGYYSVELKPGIYTVDINRIGIDSSSDVPKKIEIRPGETVKLDIDIDTGIR